MMERAEDRSICCEDRALPEETTAVPPIVPAAFAEFLTRLRPSPGESKDAAFHRASIIACLKRNFGMTRLFRSGSFGNGTSISSYSDVDYFAVIPRGNVDLDSGKFLTSVRTVLDKRFPNTGVRICCPAVRVPFGTTRSKAHEIVPAFDTGKKSGVHPIYGIAGCGGKWMSAGPDAHNAYVRSVDVSRCGKVKPLIRLIKAWKYYCDVPIRSFYLELRVAKYCEGERCIAYSYDVQRALKNLSDVGLASIQDPKGISGLIAPCATQAQLEEARSKLSTALTRASNAVICELAGDTRGAFESWNDLFGGNFPSYG